MAASSTNTKLKYYSLVLLVVQSTALVLILRYSRTQDVGGPKYVSSTAIVFSEVFKLVICIGCLLWENSWKWSGLQREIDTNILQKPADTLKVGIPALLYVIQNNLLFLALSCLDAATYQVTYQLKVLTTAFFSVTMLGKKLNGLKWISLVLLMAGVALVQLPKDSGPERKDAADTSTQYLGLFAIICACMTSGFAGVYFEKILKGTPVSLWVRNLQLAMFSVVGGVFMVYAYDGEAIRRDGWMQGYTTVTWIVVFLQASGHNSPFCPLTHSFCLQAVSGLTVALVVKFADNIAKGFAASLPVIFASIISWAFLNDFQPSWSFAFGASAVIGSIFLYGYEPPPPPELHTA
ncbi:putative UDP-galactose translocator [Aphelenchoides fujianensis]|nr:putative UDP-galactose translocator [Aphelenchoides fujianensis]